MNKTLDDDLILLQIELLRYDEYVQNEVAKRLGMTRKELIALFAGNKLDGRTIKTLNKEASKVIHEHFDELAAYLNASVSDAIPIISGVLAATYSQHSGGKISEASNYEVKGVGGASVNDWLEKQANSAIFSVRRFAREALEGKPLPEIVEDLNKLINTNTNQAKALQETVRAATTNDINTRLMMKSRAVKQLQHKSHLDSRTTEMCQSRHNKRWDKATLEPVGHDLPFKTPPLHFNCRSILKPIFSNDRPSDDDYSFEDWLDNMPENIQNEALGKGKAAIWRKARLEGRAPFTIRDLLNQNGRPLTLKALQDRFLLKTLDEDVSRLLDDVKAREPKITKLLGQVGKANKANLAALDYRFKSASSLRRKIESIARRRTQISSEVINDINDALRYTYVLKEQSFVSDYNRIIADLEKKGQKVVKVSNTWRKGSTYKGINLSIADGNQVYELQFHTDESFALKNGKLHELYEKFRDDSTTERDKEILRQQMIDLSSTISNPEKIGSIRKKRR